MLTVLVLKSKAFKSLLAGAGIWFFTCLVLLVLLKRNLKDLKATSANRTRFYKHATISTLRFSTALALASVLVTT